MKPETGPQSAEHNEAAKAELEALGNERLKELSETAVEHAPEDSVDRAEQAREQISRNEQAPEPVPAADKEAGKSIITTTLDYVLNYKQTLTSLQQRLRPASRSFSKVIHAPAVERSSEVLEKTVMRPSVTLGATWTALIVGGIFYETARHYGYHLSGFEMIAALIVGGILGVLIEMILRTVRHKS